MKPSKEQIEVWRAHALKIVPGLSTRDILDAACELAYAAGRKAGMQEAEELAHSMFNRAATGDEIADAICAALQTPKD